MHGSERVTNRFSNPSNALQTPSDPAMISMTPSAVGHLATLLAENNAPPGSGLRLQVDKGGCAGMQYVMRIDQPQEGDRVFLQDDVALIVDPQSLGFLANSRIDYVEALNDSGFRVDNPNAARNCGCGTSFEPVGNEAKYEQ